MSEMDQAETVESWAEIIQSMLDHCVPVELWSAILARATEKEHAAAEKRKKMRFELVPFNHFGWTADDERRFRLTLRRKSAVVQVFTRTITNNLSPEDAAKVLFAEHRDGTGSGWLPDYLAGLPALKVDMKRAAQLAGPEVRFDEPGSTT